MIFEETMTNNMKSKILRMSDMKYDCKNNPCHIAGLLEYESACRHFDWDGLLKYIEELEGKQ
jgi:hypothetical protein